MISVIIPTLNEEAHIAGCIEAVLAEVTGCRIIVCDGGSFDMTRDIAIRYPGVTVVESDKGRGRQMNRGASCVGSNVLLFLHADTILEKGWAKELHRALQDDAVIGGAFTFCIDHPSPKYRLVEAWVAMRCRLCGLPYGDQGIFIRRESFQKLGGYREIPLMEDVDLIGRMKKVGKIVVLKERAFTSGRRWVAKGVVKTAAINQVTMLLHRLGVSPDRLAKFYYR